MTRVLLLHSGSIPHYRVAVYNYLTKKLHEWGFELHVCSDRVGEENSHPITFDFIQEQLSASRIRRIIQALEVDVVILFVDMRHSYLFPTYFSVKIFFNKKIIYWGQGLDLACPESLKTYLYHLEHVLCDAIILYSEHLRKYISRRFQEKTFVANNTIIAPNKMGNDRGSAATLRQYGISTSKNIICVGRVQRRKRLDRLIEAHRLIGRKDVGVILVGPDPDGVLDGFEGDNIYKLGPVYGSEIYRILLAADVYCLPGAVGLSIVDAFHCGLPFVTEDGDESAEIAYLRDGENGFIVPRDNVMELARKLELLLDDDTLRQRFSDEAQREAATNAHIDRMCEGFRAALDYVTRTR